MIDAGEEEQEDGRFELYCGTFDGIAEDFEGL